MGGSQVFLQAGEVYTVYDLLKSDVNDGTKYKLVGDFDKVLSLNLLSKGNEKNVVDEEILNKINLRNEAKKNKNFELADQKRDELLKEGIVLRDTKDGTIYEVK